MCGNVISDAPNFDGSLEPNKFLNWLTEFENYCKHHQMEDDGRVGLAKMKLEGEIKNGFYGVNLNTNRSLGLR